MVKRKSSKRKRSGLRGKLLIIKRSSSRKNNKPVKCKRTVKRRGKNIMIINEKCSSKRSKKRSRKRSKKIRHGGGSCGGGSCGGGSCGGGSCAGSGGGHHKVGGG